MLQNMGDNLINRVSAIMKAALELSHIPLAWKMSGISFIKKPGRRDRSNPRSYRPITLSPFLLKTLEKQMINKLNKGHLKFKPLHPMQHAFRKNYSCDSALLDALDFIESGVNRKEYVMGLSLDIKGAFDNIDPAYLLKVLRERKAPEWFNKIIENYLTYRTVAVELNGKIELRQITRGTPQGSAAAPTLWAIAFDELLEIINKDGFHGIGFADDALILIKGPDPTTLALRMATLLPNVDAWARKAGLTFCPNKTQAILFPLRGQRLSRSDLSRITTNLPALELGGGKVEFKESVKY